MRKLFSLMLVVLGAAALVSCSKDDDDVLRDGEGVIMFVTKAKSLPLQGGGGEDYLRLETFNEGEKITVDWGDGWGEEEYVSVKEEDEEGDGEEVWYEIHAKHTYTDGKSSHTVIVRGKIKDCDISYCEATSIDATKCPALEYLGCYINQLTSLDVSGCTALKYLSCDDNQLTSLDVSKNTALEDLDCEWNKLTSLDVSGCTALEYLSCDDNQLTSLDVSKNTALESLDCRWNKLTSLDISKNTALHRLECYGNQFSASAMNKIYNDLPQGRVNEYGERSKLECDKLGDYSIAKKKGWNVYTR